MTTMTTKPDWRNDPALVAALASNKKRRDPLLEKISDTENRQQAALTALDQARELAIDAEALHHLGDADEKDVSKARAAVTLAEKKAAEHADSLRAMRRALAIINDQSPEVLAIEAPARRRAYDALREQYAALLKSTHAQAQALADTLRDLEALHLSAYAQFHPDAAARKITVAGEHFDFMAGIHPVAWFDNGADIAYGIETLIAETAAELAAIDPDGK